MVDYHAGKEIGPPVCREEVTLKAREWQEPHDWQNAGSVDDWIASDRARQVERLPYLQMLVGLIPFGQHDSIRVLDIGAGYGLLAHMVLEAFPNARVTCHDYSDRMFASAREKLSDFAPRVSWAKGDLLSPHWTKDLGQPFNAVVSSIAIHNVHSQTRVRAVYHELFPFVERGGCFLNLDHVGPAGSISGRFYHRSRLLERQQRLKQQQGIDVSLEELENQWQARQRKRREGLGAGKASLEVQLGWLREAGFDEVDCLWKEVGRALIAGFRSASTCP